MGVAAYRKLESEKRFNEIERMFITPFYSSKPLFTICNEEEYPEKFHNCSIKFADLKANLEYVNENFSLVEDFFKEYMAEDKGFEVVVRDVDEIELGKFLSNEEKKYFTRIHDEIASKTIEAKMLMQGGSERSRKLMGRLLMRNDIVAISDVMKKKFFSKKLSEKVNDKTDRTLFDAMARIDKIRSEKDLNEEETALMNSLESYLKKKEDKWLK
jgi:hypothetical protein